MALSAIEQLRIIAGEAKPDQTDLLSLVLQTGSIVGYDFTLNQKTTADETPEDFYRERFLLIAARAVNNDERAIAALRRLIIVILGNTSVTFNQVVGATDSQWEGFVFNNMDEAMEALAGVTPDQKAAYDAL